MYHTNSLTISKHGLTQLINSFQFAEDKCTPLNVALTLSWEKTANWTEAQYATRRELFLNNLTKWLRRQAVVPAYVWTAEISNRQGLHQHLMVHIPKHLFRRFCQKVSDLVPGFNGNPHTVEINRDQGDEANPPKWLFHHNQRLGLFKYLLKRMNHASTFNDNGTRLNLGDYIGIQHRGSEPRPLNGKRYGISHTLSLRSRLRANYTDETSPAGLKALLEPIQREVSDAT